MYIKKRNSPKRTKDNTKPYAYCKKRIRKQEPRVTTTGWTDPTGQAYEGIGIGWTVPTKQAYGKGSEVYVDFQPCTKFEVESSGQLFLVQCLVQRLPSLTRLPRPAHVGHKQKGVDYRIF